CCPFGIGSSSATPSSVNATSASKSSSRGATISSSSRTTSRACTSMSPRGSATRRRHTRSRPLFPPDGQRPGPPPGRRAQETDKGHGRLEQRTLRTTSTLTLHQEWPGLKQGFELTRRRTVKGETTTEVIYGISSLAEEGAEARRLLGLTRGHWGIENK